MRIPYHARQILKRLGVVLLAVLLAAAAVWLCWVIWLGRFVKYTREGAVLDFELPPRMAEGMPAVEPERETVPIFFNEGENAINTSTELLQLKGYYADEAALHEDIEAVKAAIKELPVGTAVMVDVKNSYGNFYYSSNVGAGRSDMVNTEAMDELIRFLDKSGMYTIAKISSLRDRQYGLHHVPDGLADAGHGGRCLWVDDNSCYWLNPSSQGTQTYLIQTITELRNLGFDEVVLDNFYFPKSDRIMFDGNKTEALTAAAATLVSACATDSFGVSFVGNGSWTLPEGRSRLYIRDVEASQAENKAEELNLSEPQIKVVFLTDVHDTRFDAYGVLRPLSAAH